MVISQKGEIRGDEGVVSRPQVPEPVAVRYGWANNPEVSPFNKEELTATPLRTDNFPIITKD